MNKKYVKQRWQRRIFTFAAMAILLLVLALPAFAISFGEPDGNDHPSVGSIVWIVPGEGLFQICSGTLISEKVYLTASHCTDILDSLLADIPGSSMAVTFDPTISESSTYYTGTWYTHPNWFAGNGMSDPNDVAVIVLDESPGITPSSLPTEGLLDQLKARGVLKHTRFTVVGYGTVRETNTTGPHGFLQNMDRNRAEQGFNSLTKAWLNLPMTLANGNGGTCYGDSGGPHFIHLDGRETNIVVSVTSTGDIPCVASDKTYRVDTANAREFLAQFVELP